MKDDEQAGRAVETGGGSYIEGDVYLGRGDLVAGDKIVYPAPPLSIPLQRPRRAEHFVGRERALARLVVALQPGEVITVCGAGGIGKSALAAEAIWTLAPGAEPPERFPDGIITHRFYHQPQAALALEAIARAYGEAPLPTPRDAAQRALAGRKALLFLDGAENADDLSSILEVCSGCGVLITSRRRRDAFSTRRDVLPLPLEDAVALLRAWGGPHAADEQAARRVCQLVGGLPMAVRLAGRYLAEVDEPVGAYLAWLEETPLEALDLGKRRRESVPVLLERSLSQVNERARVALSVAGVLAPAPFGAAAVAAGLDVPDRDVLQALGELVSYGLLVRTAERYVASHALVHTYARERCPPAEAAVVRLAAYYTASAREHSALGTEGYRRLDRERVHVMQVLGRCAEGSRGEALLDLVWAVRGYLAAQGYWADLQRAMGHARAAARALGDRDREASCLVSLGDAHRMLSEYEEARAYYAEAQPIYAAIENRLGEANCVRAMGHVHLRLSECAEARARYAEAWPIYAVLGDRQGEANCIRALGDVHLRLSEYEDARAKYEQAQQIYAVLGDRLGEVNCIFLLGNVSFSQDRYEDAREWYEQAWPIYAALGARLGEANCLRALGDVHLQTSEYVEARVWYEKARAIYTAMGDRQGEASCLFMLGDVHLQLGECEAARARYQETHNVYARMGDRLGEANCIKALGDVHFQISEYEDARARYQEVRPMLSQMGDRAGYARATAKLGLTHRALGQVMKARQCLEEAIGILDELGSATVDRLRQRLADLDRAG